MEVRWPETGFSLTNRAKVIWLRCIAKRFYTATEQYSRRFCGSKHQFFNPIVDASHKPTGVQHQSNFRLFSQSQRVFDIDTEIANSIF